MNTNTERKKIEQILTKELSKPTAFDGFFSAMDALPNPDLVLMQSGKGIAAYRELKLDAHLWSCIQSRKSGLLSLSWSLEQNSTIDDKVYKSTYNMLNRLDIHNIMRDILEAPLFGWQPLEIMWETEKATGELLPSAVIARPHEWFQFNMRQELIFKKNLSDSVVISKYKVLCPRFEATYDNPYGNSLLSKCYWPIIFKNGGLKNWVHFADRYGMPILMGQYTRGSTREEANKLADALADMSEDSIIVTPSDINITLHEAVRSTSNSLYKELIKYCNSEISKAILSQTLTTELELGSYAASQTHFKIRKEVILSDIRLVESTINTLINYYIELNFASQAPRFSINADEELKSEKLEIDLKIARESGYKLSKEYLMRNYNFYEGDLID